MKVAQPSVGQIDRDANARVDILRKAGVEGRGERDFALQAVAARGQAERTLGGDMDGVRREGLDLPPDAGIRQKAQADLGVGRAGD